MKWEDYNRMNNRLKEEYNYRFKNHPVQINIRGIGFIVIVMYLLVVIMLFVSYVVITDEMFIDYRDSVIDILKSSSQLMMTGIVIILIIAFIDIFNVIFWCYKEKKWIRQNNIRITHTNILLKMFRSRR